MTRSGKAALAIIIILILVSLSYYYFFILVEEDRAVEPAPEFKFYDSEEFISSQDPQPISLKSFRDSMVLLYFIDTLETNTTEQDNVTSRIHNDYPDVVIITIDIFGESKSMNSLNTYKIDSGYDWYFTLDDGKIAKAYDIVFIPTVIIIDEDGYGTYIEEKYVDYDELSENLDKTISKTAEHINVGLLPGVQKAPDFSETDIDGRSIKLSDFRGKVVLLDFMSLTCTSCKQAEKVLKEIHKDFDEKDLIIISIDIDPTDSVDALKDHRAKEGLNWSIVRDPGDLKLKYHVTEIVKIMLIDKKGYLVYEHIGAPSRDDLKNEIEDAKAGKSAAIEIEELSIYIFAVLMGIGTFFSPCSFPMLPGYMSYYLQKDLGLQTQNTAASEESKTNKRKKGTVKRALASGSVSAVGIVLVFTIISVIALIVGEQVIKPYIPILGPIVGVILLVLGGLMMTNLQYNKIIQPFQNLYRNMAERLKRSKLEEGEETTSNSASPTDESGSYYSGLFTYGIGYGAAAAACTAPLFIGLIFNLLILPIQEGALVLTIYILSMVILMISVTVAISVAGQSSVQKLSAYTGHIKKFGGIVLFAAGVYLIWFWYASL
jgi:cytochrome c-type biogenesis protein